MVYKVAHQCSTHNLGAGNPALSECETDVQRAHTPDGELQLIPVPVWKIPQFQKQRQSDLY